MKQLNTLQCLILWVLFHHSNIPKPVMLKGFYYMEWNRHVPIPSEDVECALKELQHLHLVHRNGILNLTVLGRWIFFCILREDTSYDLSLIKR